MLIVNGVVREQQTVCLLKQHYEVSYLEMGTEERSVTVYVIDPVPQSSAPVYVSGGPREGWGFPEIGRVCLVFDMTHSSGPENSNIQYHWTNIKSKVYQKI